MEDKNEYVLTERTLLVSCVCFTVTCACSTYFTTTIKDVNIDSLGLIKQKS